MQPDDQVTQEALGWAVRTLDPAFADWDGFTHWLEASAEHRAAYDRIAAAAVEAGELAASGAAVPDAASAPVGSATRRRWLGGALAASVAGLLAIGLWQRTAPDLQVRQTAPGQVLAVALEDGSRIDLAGGSRLTLDRNNPRFARLDGGRALFTVRHDAADPFVVEAGGHELLDAGTVFDVRDDAGGFAVAVAEGAVIVDPSGAAVRLDAGDRLSEMAGEDRLIVEEVATADIGSWRDGRLTFTDASLAEVAAELTRASGHHFAIVPGAPRGSLTGSIQIAAVRSDPTAAAALLGVPVRRQGATWLIGGG
ncbi:FecR domain-containing protein [Croceibacterium sp. TMG7-5b_MA50]|uniref:FecR family protein n=1 Tax=Croceibacterium sp. TMG7-5b_MA50 TaxID=3121290 RepID=UPI003221D3CB